MAAATAAGAERPGAVRTGSPSTVTGFAAPAPLPVLPVEAPLTRLRPLLAVKKLVPLDDEVLDPLRAAPPLTPPPARARRVEKKDGFSEEGTAGRGAAIEEVRRAARVTPTESLVKSMMILVVDVMGRDGLVYRTRVDRSIASDSGEIDLIDIV